MLRFYYEPRYKYTNRTIIDLSGDTQYKTIDYENIDSPDTINGHIIYVLQPAEKLPTYIVDLDSGWRWFVSGITQLRTGKFQISLLRDIISENPNLWKQEEAYITAGLATDYNKYKKWDLPFTNTKVGEQRLNINGKSSFFVYYVNQQQFSNGVLSEQDLKISQTAISGITSFDVNIENLSQIPSFEYVGAGEVNNWQSKNAFINFGMMVQEVIEGAPIPTSRYTFAYKSSLGDSDNFYKSSEGTGAYGSNWQDPLENSVYILAPYERLLNNENNIRYNLTQATKNFLNTYTASYGSEIPQSSINNLSSYVGKIIRETSTNKVYRINLTKQTNEINLTLSSNETSSFLGSIRNLSFPGLRESSNNFNVYGNYFTFNGSLSKYTYTLEELGTATSFDFTFIANQRKLPKSAVRCVNIVESEGITNESITQALMLAQTNGINEDNTTGRILDIQYLPFSIATTTNENLKINGNPLVAQFLDFDDYRFTTDLPDLTNINKETDTIKIVSPSRASQFLFNPYNNDGNMLFETKITLKPFASVIYVRPSTKGLLLEDWDDKDCLIIQEDFSLTNVTSQWTEYIYNNRTYLNAFERQIQGREFERSWEKRIEKAQAKSDEWTATQVHADKMKTYTGNIPVFSNLVAGIGAIAGVQDQNYLEAARTDRAYNEALYQEGLDLSRDMFDMQIENIRSQPLVPSKVTTIDCKFLDGIYLEFYSTNQTELAAIKNFYRYNGNRIDTYGTFAQYYGWFVRGKIIKSIYYTQPEIEELNRRLSMGIFTEVNYDQ